MQGYEMQFPQFSNSFLTATFSNKMRGSMGEMCWTEKFIIIFGVLSLSNKMSSAYMHAKGELVCSLHEKPLSMA
jgi:hypothetical protein